MVSDQLCQYLVAGKLPPQICLDPKHNRLETKQYTTQVSEKTINATNEALTTEPQQFISTLKFISHS